MTLKAACLNTSNPEVKEYINNIGYEKTYEQYVKNGYVLPAWEDYLQNQNSIPIEYAKNLISDILPADDYRFENIRKIMFDVPVETQAAFWNNVFYFQNSVSKDEIGEESFHALFGTIFDTDTKNQLLSIGRRRINVKQEVERYSSLYPSIMNPLTNEEKENRVIEEYLASQFREWYVENKDNLSSREKQVQKIKNKYKGLVGKLAEILYDFFDTLRTIFNTPARDRNYLDSLFKSIINGKYKNVKSIRSDTSSPLLSVLNYTRDGIPSTLSESESERIVNTIVATFLKEKENDEVRNDEEILEDVLQAVKIHFENSDLNYSTSLFNPTIDDYNFETFVLDKKRNPEYTALLEEVSLKIQKAKKLKEPFLEEDQGENISDENEDEGSYFFADSIQANEVGYEGWSSWIRSYLSTIASTTTEVTLPLDKTIKVVSPIDVNTLYNGVARAVQNTSNDIIRLRKIIEYSELNNGENTTAKAFINQLIGDTINNYSQSEIDAIISLIKNSVDGTFRNPGETDDVYYKKIASSISDKLVGKNTKLLNGIVKGFDMWRRELRTQTITTNNGKVEQNTFNSNVQGNSTATQIRKWQKQYNDAERDLKYFTKDSEDRIGLSIIGETREERSKYLNTQSVNIRNIFKDQLGVDLAISTVKFLVIGDVGRGLRKQTLEDIFLPSDVNFYNLFKNDISNVVKEKEYTSLLSGIIDNINSRNLKSYTEIQESPEESFGTIFDSEKEGGKNLGVLTRLRNLASVNAFFDENVVETTFKNAENKTIYAFQHKSFSLEFEKNVMTRSWMENRINKGYKILREDSRGNKIYLTEGIEFVRENRLLKPFIKKEGNFFSLTGDFENRFQNFKLFGFDGIRQRGEREGDGITFGGITTAEFDAFRLNLYGDPTNHITVDGTTYVPFYVGNYEAKRSADFVYLPWDNTLVGNDGKYTSAVSEAIKEEFSKEYNRIKKLSDAIRTYETTTDGLIWKNEKSKITPEIARKIFKTDAFEKYNVGTLTRIKDENGNYKYFGLRGLEFSDNLKGLISSGNKTSLVNSALDGKSFEDSWNYNQDVIDQQEILLKKTTERLRPEPLINVYKNKDTATKTLRGVLINNLLNTMAYKQLMHGDPTLLYKNDGVDAVKRNGGIPAAISGSEYYIINPSLGITEPQTHIKYVVGEEFQESVSYNPLVKKDGADAQNWGTVDYYRKQLWAQGKLTPFEARLLDKIQIGLPLSASDIDSMRKRGIFFNVMKTVGFDGQVYLKKSDLMLTRQFTSILQQHVKKEVDALNMEYENDFTSSERKLEIQDRLVELYTPESNWMANPERIVLHNMRVALESKGIDLYMPKSASKMLNVNVHDNISDGTFSTIENNVQFIEAKYYGLQLENPAGKERIYDPTQMLEIIFNEQNPKIQVLYNNTVQSLKSLEETWQDYIVARENGVYNTTKNEFVLPNGEFNIETLFNRMTEMLVQSDADFQTIEIFREKINPNIGITKEKFEHLYFSLFTKGVIKQKVNGDALAHLSPFGVKKLKKAVRYTLGEQEFFTWEVIQQGTPEWNQIIYGNNYVEFSPEGDDIIYDGSKDTDQLRTFLKKNWNDASPFYFIDGVRHLKPRYDVDEDGKLKSSKPIAWFSESIIPKWNDKIDINDNSKWMFGVRIPSQDKHSAVNVEWIATMPEFYGNTISVPVEVMEISGHDFDVDKLFMIKPEHYESEGKIIYFKKGENRERNYREYIEYLKQYHRSFNKAYKEAVKQKNLEYSERYEEIRNLKSQRDSISIGRDGTQDLRIKTQLQYDKFKLNEKIQQLYDGLIEIDEDFLEQISKILTDLNLPTKSNFDKEGPLVSKNGEYNNPLAINNELLKIRQIALTNEGTLNEDNGQAIYKTPATQSALQDLQDSVTTSVPNSEITDRKEFEKRKDFARWTDTGAEIYLFKTPEFGKLFSTTNEVPMHSFVAHSIAHQNNTTGKRNISAGVNSLLSLITIIKGGLKVNPGFEVILDGHVGNKFTFRNADDERIFDLISTIISAATDEAKDQQNATYNIGLKALGILRVMLGLGFPMSTSIALINQPIAQRYFKAFALRDQAVLTRDEMQVAFRDSEEILTELGYSQVLGSTRDISLEELVADIKLGKTSDNLKQSVLAALDTFEKMSTQFDEINRLVKLKKGFDDGLSQLDKLSETFGSLGFNLKSKLGTEMWLNSHPIDTRKIKRNKNLKQINNYIFNIIPDQVELTSKLFLERSIIYQGIKDEIRKGIKETLNTKDSEILDGSIFEFVSVLSKQLYNGIEVDPTLMISGKGSLGSRILKLRKTISDFEKRKHLGIKSLSDQVLSTLIGNTVVNKLFIRSGVNIGGNKIDTIEMNTFSKMSNEDQDNIISAFQVLDVATNNSDLYDDFPEFKGISNDLFNYFITKDAYQFKANSLSKIFPASYFGEHGKALEEVSNYYSNFSKIYLNRDIDNESIIINSFFEAFLSIPENRKFLKRLYKNNEFQSDGIVSLEEGMLKIDVRDKELNPEYYNLSTGKDGVFAPPALNFSIKTPEGMYTKFYILDSVDGVKVGSKYFGKEGEILKYKEVDKISNGFQSPFTQFLTEFQEDVPQDILDKSQKVSNLGETSHKINMSEPINIYSTDKNGYEKLSNLLNGPITKVIDGVTYVFQTVEHMFQIKKALFAGDVESANKIMAAPNGWEAQKLGSKKGPIKWNKNSPEKWDEISSQELEKSMKDAFEQNIEIRNLLLSTGDSVLTHKGKFNLGKWETEFPRILMEIRDNYKSDVNNQEKTSYNSTSIKEGVDFVFEQNPELSTIGSKEQYSQYLDTIFPDSKVKDILKHTSVNKFETFNIGKGRLGEGIYFASSDYSMYDKIGDNVYYTVVNVNNIKRYDNGEFVKDSLNKFPSKDEYSMEPQKLLQQEDRNNNVDAYISTSPKGTEYNIFFSEQIHILGSKQDIEEFKNYMSNQTTPFEDSFGDENTFNVCPE